MATYKTQVQWGGFSRGEWHDDFDLVIEIKNRKDVIPDTGVPSEGTQVSWSCPNGNGNITFCDEGTTFMGTARFPDEGTVGYQGELKS